MFSDSFHLFLLPYSSSLFYQQRGRDKYESVRIHQFVTDHFVGYKYRNVLTTIMTAMVKPIMLGKIVERRDQVPGASCLRFPPLSLPSSASAGNKRTFLERTWHGLSSKIIC